MKIADIFVKKVSDSRGEPAIEVGLVNEKDERFSAQIPSGRSRGSREAAVLTPGEARGAMEKAKKEITDRYFSNIKTFDDLLLALDGTADKKNLGGNLMLGLSLSFARGLAREKNQEFWQILREEFFPEAGDAPPKVFSNLINGGVHAKNNLDIQEYLVIVDQKDIEKLKKFYQELEDSIKNKYKLAEVSLGDEGGYSLDFSNNFEPLGVLEEKIRSDGLEREFKLGIDAAASSFYGDGKYFFEERSLKSEKLLKIYLDYFEKAPLLNSIEDPFQENDGKNFAMLHRARPDKLIVGDDLITTNPGLIRKAVYNEEINGVIIKPNQIGTVSETCEAINTAHEGGLKCIVSHRSGETPDNFLIHFAKASGAYGVKIGAPVASRISKFEELKKLYG